MEAAERLDQLTTTTSTGAVIRKKRQFMATRSYSRLDDEVLSSSSSQCSPICMSIADDERCCSVAPMKMRAKQNDNVMNSNNQRRPKALVMAASRCCSRSAGSRLGHRLSTVWRAAVTMLTMLALLHGTRPSPVDAGKDPAEVPCFGLG
ncbi:uncharacterized protein LOC129759999 isoform X2 [Uranotaenia lowii]|uniref:uncharacterized protein LOC129759999 isoform X2 n=1 Tax=Uranotaenia lowii TaxID=190385 RepID=UPI00247AF8DD|nr:uncharacterized protein LOC129759999 isoform X2 [Uranotaenia lowii]